MNIKPVPGPGKSLHQREAIREIIVDAGHDGIWPSEIREALARRDLHPGPEIVTRWLDEDVNDHITVMRHTGRYAATPDLIERLAKKSSPPSAQVPLLHQAARNILTAFMPTGWQDAGVPEDIIITNLQASRHAVPSRETLRRWLVADEALGLTEEVTPGRWRATQALQDVTAPVTWEYTFHAGTAAGNPLGLLLSTAPGSGRFIMNFTEPEFTSFRDQLGEHGVILFQITRVQVAEPEEVR